MKPQKIKKKKKWKKTFKTAKIMKCFHAYKDCASTYNTEMSNSFNPELQIKDAESVIRNNLIDLLTELKRFKFVVTMVLEWHQHNSSPQLLSS